MTIEEIAETTKLSENEIRDLVRDQN